MPFLRAALESLALVLAVGLLGASVADALGRSPRGPDEAPGDALLSAAERDAAVQLALASPEVRSAVASRPVVVLAASLAPPPKDGPGARVVDVQLVAGGDRMVVAASVDLAGRRVLGLAVGPNDALVAREEVERARDLASDDPDVRQALGNPGEVRVSAARMAPPVGACAQHRCLDAWVQPGGEQGWDAGPRVRVLVDLATGAVGPHPGVGA